MCTAAVGTPPGRAPHDRDLRERRAATNKNNFSEINTNSPTAAYLARERMILVSHYYHSYLNVNLLKRMINTSTSSIFSAIFLDVATRERCAFTLFPRCSFSGGNFSPL